MENIQCYCCSLDESNPNSSVQLKIEDINQLDPRKNYWLHIEIPEADEAADNIVKALFESLKIAPEFILQNLFAEATHPKSLVYQNCLLLILRGVNPNPTEYPSDMVSLRIWLTENKLITVSRQPIKAIQENRKSIEEMETNSPAECLIYLIWYVFADIDEEIYNIDCLLDDIEQSAKSFSTQNIQESVLSIRQQIISFRRYLLPQRDAIKRLSLDKITWMSGENKHQLDDFYDNMQRYVEYLNSIRERASVLQERMLNRIQEDLNNKMCIVSVVALIFMPASFITGLFGMNMEIPEAYTSKWTFWIIITIIFICTIGLYFYFRRRGWLKFN